MRCFAVVCLMALFAAAGAAFAVAGLSERFDGIAAYVNDRPVTIGDVIALMTQREARRSERRGLEERRQQLADDWRAALDEAIARELILQEFKRREARVPDRAVEEEINSLVTRRYEGNRAAFLDDLARERRTLEDFRQRIRDSLAVLLLRQQAVADQVQFRPGAVLDFYRRNLQRYSVPAAARVCMITLRRGATEEERAQQRTKAERLRDAAVAGADFAALAREHSEDDFRQQGGDRGWVPLSSLRRELAAAVENLKPGEISPVVEAGDHLFIVCVVDRLRASVVPFEEVRDEIGRQLRRAEEQRLFDEWLAVLRRRHYVRVLVPDPPE